MKKLIAICYAGGKPRKFSEHDTVSDAKKFFGSKVQLNKSHFVKAIGYIKLITKSEFLKGKF